MQLAKWPHKLHHMRRHQNQASPQLIQTLTRILKRGFTRPHTSWRAQRVQGQWGMAWRQTSSSIQGEVREHRAEEGDQGVKTIIRGNIA